MADNTTGANLISISPFFIVSDIGESVAFYVSQLKFEVLHISPANDPFFAIVGRGGVSIMLKAIADNVKAIPNYSRHEWARWDAYIYTADPDILFEEYTLNGLTFKQSIQDDEDGLRGFEVADADGYMLFFGRPKV